MEERWAIVADGLHYDFAGGYGVHGISFKIPTGQVFSLLGPNGAGKTTTIKLLTGQLRPQSGQVSIFGLDPGVHSEEVRRYIGVMQEDPGHYQRLSVRTNIKFFASLYGVSGEYADKLIEQMGLSDKADVAVSKLSRGMRQRLALARAMIGKPKVLFLDEPTSGLDPLSAQGVRAMIDDYCKGGGTVFLTTHYMEEAEYLSHCVAIIQDGKLLCKGHYIDLCQQYLPKTIEVVRGGRTVECSPGLEQLFFHITGRSINCNDRNEL